MPTSVICYPSFHVVKLQIDSEDVFLPRIFHEFLNSEFL